MARVKPLLTFNFFKFLAMTICVFNVICFKYNYEHFFSLIYVSPWINNELVN